MNKLIIPIIAVLIITAGIGAYFILQKPAFSEPKPPMGRCGDGICDEFEKANPNLCPKDCRPTGSAPELEERISEDSPFGFLEPFIDAMKVSNMYGKEPEYFVDLGAKFAREGRFVWERFEKSPGSYDWSQYDNIFSLAQQKNAVLLLSIGAINRNDQKKCRKIGDRCLGRVSCTPCDMESYSNFLTASINRYKDKVKYWQIDNEVNHSWKESPENYADFLKINYDLIKQNCPECKVVIAGVSSRPSDYYSFYRKVIERAGQIKRQGKGDSFDIFDFHWAGYYGDYKVLQDILTKQDYNFKTYVADIKNDLKANNINADMWITEMATYSGDPVDDTGGGFIRVNPPQSEKQQAIELIKRYIYSLSAGIKKIFWVKIIEWRNFGNKGVNRYYDNTGLVNNPGIDGDSSKKLSYYTYKKMVEVLEGNDWSNIQTAQEKDGIYIYKFIKNNKPIWVAWNDNFQEEQVTIPDITSAQVKITEAIPDYASGKEVMDYGTAFKIQTKTVKDAQATITLNDIPVFVEEE